MADKQKRITDLPAALLVSGNDIFTVVQDEISTKIATTDQIGEAITTSQSFSQLETISKNIIGAINEINRGGGSAGSLAELSDVTITSATLSDGQVLRYDIGTQSWINANPSGGSLESLTDVTITSLSLSNGQFLVYDNVSDKWVNKEVIHEPITQAQYDAMVEAGTVDPTVYYPITDASIEAGDIDYDNTSSGLEATDVQDAIDELKSIIPSVEDIIDDNSMTDDKTWSAEKLFGLLPTGVASGAVANFKTSLAYPLVSLKGEINAIQEAGTPTPSAPLPISGVSEVNIYQLGSNFFDKTVLTTGALINGAGSEVTYADWNISDYVPVIEGASYYLYGLTQHPNTSQDNFELFDANKEKIGFANVKTNEQPYTIPSGVKYVKFSVKDPDIDTAQFGVSKNTTYQSYNAAISVNTISLGDTCYGGYITKDSSGTKLVITYAYADLSDFTWNNSTEGYSQSPVIPNMKKTASGSSMPTMLCSSLLVDTPTNVYNKASDNSVSIAITTANSGLRVYMSTLAGYTGIQVQAALEGYMIAYELETPIVIDLTDTAFITASVGINNIFVDTGDTTVTYKKTVDDAIAELQALILS